jgi:chaperonin cofactor prefoldin
MYRTFVSRLRALGFALCMTVIAVSAEGQTPRSGGGAASAQLLQQLQQLGSERASLQSQNEKLQKDLDAARKERDALKAGQQALQKRAQLSEAAVKEAQAGLAARRETADRELADWKQKTQELVAKFRETAQTLRDVESDRNDLKQSLAARNQAYAACVQRNAALYKLNGEILDRMEHQSVWSSLAQAEPFTRLKRTQLENMVDEYVQKADDQRVLLDAASGVSSAASKPAAGPAPSATPPASR